MNVPALKIFFEEKEIEDILTRIKISLVTGKLFQGQWVEECEEKFAKFSGVEYAVAVSSGSTALEILFRYIKQYGAKSVVAPVNTFYATARAAEIAGLNVVFADIEEEYLGLSPVVDADAIVPVHIGGLMNKKILPAKGKWNGVWLIEDCCHAVGSDVDGIKAGASGCGGAVSFFSTKVFTMGEGGMIITNEKDVAEFAKQYRNFGKDVSKPWETVHAKEGYNCRMNEIAATILIEFLDRADKLLDEREKIAQLYKKLLSPQLKVLSHNGRNSWYKVIVVSANTKPLNGQEIEDQMKTRYNISLPGAVYRVPLHKQPVYAKTDTFPVAEKMCASHICLPIYRGIKSSEVEYVAESLNKIQNNEKGDIE